VRPITIDQIVPASLVAGYRVTCAYSVTPTVSLGIARAKRFADPARLMAVRAGGHSYRVYGAP